MKRHDSNRNLVMHIFPQYIPRRFLLLLKTKISFLRENKLPAEVSKDNGFLRIAQQIDFMPAN